MATSLNDITKRIRATQATEQARQWANTSDAQKRFMINAALNITRDRAKGIGTKTDTGTTDKQPTVAPEVQEKEPTASTAPTAPTAPTTPTTPEAPEAPEAAQPAQTEQVKKPEATAFTPTATAPEYQTIDYAKRLEELGGGKYTPSENVTAAQDYLNSIISSKPGSYQSRYGDQLDALYNQIMNREDFSYDLNGDALYQQYRDRYIAQGQSAMRDATAQAAALTGGYGNSYAATAGNLAYQSYLQQLNDVVPELYQQAYQRYLQEGEDLQNRYAITQAADEADYGRWRDSYNDWINDRAYAQAAYESAYGQDYSDYTNRLNSAMSMLGMEQSDMAQANSNAFSRYLTDLGYERSDYEYGRDESRADYEYDRDAARQDQLLQQQYDREDKLTADEREYNRGLITDEREYNRELTEDERRYNQSLIESEREYNDGLTDQSYYRDLVANVAAQGKLPPQTLLGLAGLTADEAVSLARAYGYRGKGYGSTGSSSSSSSGSSRKNNTTGSSTGTGSTDSTGSTTGSDVSYDKLLNWATSGSRYQNYNAGWSNSGLTRDEYDSSRRKNYAKK